VTDTLVRQFGNVDLSSLFAFTTADPLDSGDALAGLDEAATTEVSDPLAFLGCEVRPADLTRHDKWFSGRFR
jgi:hypothetical protein